MASYEEAIEALRRADAAGNAEDAKKLAKIAQRLKAEAENPSVSGSAGADLMRSFGSGVADILGAPVDLTTAVLRAAGAGISPYQFGGSENIRSGLARAGVAFRRDEEPTDFGSRLARETGSAAIPYGGMMARGAQIAGRTAKGAVDRLAQAVAKRPVSSAAFEGASVTGAAAGGAIADSQTDNPAIIALSELAGGLSPTAALALPGAAAAAARKVPTVGAVIRATTPFTETGGRLVASRRLQGLTEDPARAAERLSGSDTLEGVVLSPARRIGEGRLLALEREILKADPALDAKFSEQLAQANAQTRTVAHEYLGDPSRAKRLLEGRREHLLGLVDTRAAQAAREAREAISRLGPDATERQISIAVRGKVDDALKAARSTEKELWEAIDRGAPARLSRGQKAYKSILAERTEAADPADLPDYAGRLLSKEKTVTVGYLQDLRSRLLDDAAKARAGGERNKARILGDLAASLLDDLETAGPSAKAASDFSRHLNDRFTRGSVGRLLGHADDRGLRVDPSETLEFMDQGKDIGRANRLTQLLEAAPESAADVERYLSGAFTRQAMDGGAVNPEAAKRFAEKYGEVLERFPQLRERIRQAETTSARAVSAQERAKRVTKALGNQRMSRASLYLDGAVGEEWRRVLNADDPVKESRALLRQVRRDPDAVQGLKQGFVDELLRRSETANVDEAGELIVSGKRLRKVLAENKAVADALLSPAERGRLDRIANTFARIEAKPGEPVKVLDDKISNLLDFAATYLGAQSGGRLAKQMGSSLVLAGRGASMYRGIAEKLTTNKARMLIHGAVDDPDLFRALLVGPTEPAKKQTDALRRVHAWLAVPISGEQESGDGE
jgi:hypothetical protein